MSDYSLSLAGRFRVSTDGVTVRLPAAANRVVALVATGGPLPRGVAAAHLWPDLRRERSRANMRTVMWRLHTLAPGLLSEEDDSLDLMARCDIHELRCWTDAVLSGAEGSCSGGLPALLGCELLPGWADPWVVQAREELHLLGLHAIEEYATRCLLDGRLGEACQAALRAHRADPLRESAVRLLVQVHLAGGNVAAALAAYSSFTALLAHEIGAAPGADLRDLVSPHLARIPRARISLAASGPSGDRDGVETLRRR